MSAQAPQHLIFISVGSNINREQHINAGLDAMYAAFGELTLSSRSEEHTSELQSPD